MTRLALLFAQLDTFNPLGPMPPVSKATGGMAKDLMLIGGALLVLCVLLVLWARRYARRSKHHRRHEHGVESRPAVPENPSSRRHHRHRHRHRRRHRSAEVQGKNPTLAETGGLPPLRTESSPQPPA
jgi:hypothetical protein